MKRKGFIIAVVIISFVTQKTNAQTYKTALGVRFSSKKAAVSNSISLKYFFSPSVAIEGLVSISDPVAIGLLIEKHKPLLGSSFTWFYGAGAYVGLGGNRNFGGQGVLGIDCKIQTLPLNISVDWKPELNFTKQFSFEPAAIAASFRFTFN